MMKYTAAMFDLDGTLTESGEGITKSFRYAFEKMELPLADDADLSVVIGPPLKGSFARFGVPEDRLDEAVRTYRERYNTIGKYENRPYPGVAEMLTRLRDKGIRLYVATSKPEPMAKDILNHFSLDQYFDEIAGATFDGSRGTKKEVIEYLLEKTGFSGRAVMVGDTEFDIIGAHETGIDALGVNWGYGTYESMKQAKAEGIAETMEQLYGMIAGS